MPRKKITAFASVGGTIFFIALSFLTARAATTISFLSCTAVSVTTTEAGGTLNYNGVANSVALGGSGSYALSPAAISGQQYSFTMFPVGDDGAGITACTGATPTQTTTSPRVIEDATKTNPSITSTEVILETPNFTTREYQAVIARVDTRVWEPFELVRLSLITSVCDPCDWLTQVEWGLITASEALSFSNGAQNSCPNLTATP